MNNGIKINKDVDKEKEKEKEKFIANQRKEKLKEMLISKLNEKYNITNNENQYLLQQEISKFVVGEKITDTDLKNLDEKLKEIISKNKKETCKKINNKEIKI